MVHIVDAHPVAFDPEGCCDALEQGAIVRFPAAPVPLPPEPDLEFLRNEMPEHLRRKNVSYHPELGRVVGISGAAEIREKANRILREHNARVTAFLERAIAPLARGWTVATSSFRPLEEKGRALSAHASNERVHVDAGAYGATHGNRILRFFINANPVEDRVWISKGTFPEVYRRYGRVAGVSPRDGRPRRLTASAGQRLLSRCLGRISAWGLPLAKLADTSPYDRLMRRFHNFMKDSEEFQRSPDGHQQFSFAPGSAWMVFTDMVTHACISGRHAFIDTYIIPRGNCRRADLTPYAFLQGVPT